MAGAADRTESVGARLVHDIVTIARNFLQEIEEQLAEGSDGRTLAELPGFPAEFGMGRVLAWQAVLAFVVHSAELLADGGLPEVRDGLPDDATVGLAWLTNLIRRLTKRWHESGDDLSQFTFVGNIITAREEGLAEGESPFLLTDVLTVEESDDQPRDEAFERLARRMIDKADAGGPAWRFGFILVPATAADLGPLSRAVVRLREEGQSREGPRWCIGGFPVQRRFTVDASEREALTRAIDLLASTLDDDEATEETGGISESAIRSLPPAILEMALDPANSRPLFFQSVEYVDAKGREMVGETLRHLDEVPVIRSAYGTHILKKTHGVGKAGRYPSPQRVGEILGKAREFIRAVETCIPVEDDPECNATLHDFPWLDGEFYVCRAASELHEAMAGDDGEHGRTGATDAYGWDLETNLGLRWLFDHLEGLLTKWRVTDWEQRLTMGRLKPEFRVTVTLAELKALSRAVESIERGLARDDKEDDVTTDVDGPSARESVTGDKASDTDPQESGRRQTGPPPRDAEPAGAPKRARIVAAFYESRGASTNAEIAAEVGANEGYVSRVLKPIRDDFRAMNRDELARGRKGPDRAVEAWEA